MIEKIRRLLREPLSFEGSDDDLDGLFPNLLGNTLCPPAYEFCRIGVFWHLPMTLGNRSDEPLQNATEARVFFRCISQGGEEAAVLSSMTGRPGWVHPVEQRGAVAVEANFDHPLGITASLTLAPDLTAGAGVVVSLAGPYSLLYSLHGRASEHETLTRSRVLCHA